MSELVPHSCLPLLWDSISTSFIPSYTVSNVCFKNEGQEEGDVLEPLKVYSQDADVIPPHNIDEKTTQRDFPGGTVVKTLNSQSGGMGLNPGRGTNSLMPHGAAKRKKSKGIEKKKTRKTF